MKSQKPDLKKVDELVSECFSKVRKVIVKKNIISAEANMAIARFAQEMFYQTISGLLQGGISEEHVLDIIKRYGEDAISFAKSQVPKKNEIH